MAKIVIEGGQRLRGTVRIGGAKNAVLPILAASCLGGTGTSQIEDIPNLTDADVMLEMLRALGATVKRIGTTARINARNMASSEPLHDLVRRMRASFLVAGPLLARTGEAIISAPGGCQIGQRPVDLHIKGFEAMGASYALSNGNIHLKAPRGGLHGARIYLDVPSVTATENIMMAATLADGQTIIENAAKEPEIVDLATYLSKMGANVRGAGTDVIRIDGVSELQGATHNVIPDRIEAGTFLMAAAVMGDGVFVENAMSDHIMSVIAKLEEAGARIEDDVTGLRVYPVEQRMRAIDVKTHYYPSYPTDLQAPMVTCLAQCLGVSTVTETVFENRFLHVAELRRMGANIQVEGRTAIIEGISQLSGAEVRATDLRAAAALVIAGLMADGLTEVNDIYHLDRGYDDMVGKFRALGAKIQRVEESSRMAGSIA